MHHFVTEMCACVHISVTKWCIVVYLSDALWDLWDGSMPCWRWRHDIERLPHHWPFLWGNHRSPVDLPRKRLVMRNLILSLLLIRTNYWTSSRVVDDWRRNEAHVTVVLEVIPIFRDVSHLLAGSTSDWLQWVQWSWQWGGPGGVKEGAAGLCPLEQTGRLLPGLQRPSRPRAGGHG